MTVIDDKLIQDALARPSDFAYFGDNDDLFVTWGLCGPSMHRDSDCLQESNYITIWNDLFGKFPDDVSELHSNHWAVGWIDQIMVRVIDDEGNPTPAFEALIEWNDALNDYPVADEDDFSRREWEDFVECIEQYWSSTFYVEDQEYETLEGIPEYWAEDVASWLFDTHSIRSSEEVGEDYVLEALVELDYAKVYGD
jgi:hypothetical protein